MADFDHNAQMASLRLMNLANSGSSGGEGGGSGGGDGIFSLILPSAQAGFGGMFNTQGIFGKPIGGLFAGKPTGKKLFKISDLPVGNFPVAEASIEGVSVGGSFADLVGSGPSLGGGRDV